MADVTSICKSFLKKMISLYDKGLIFFIVLIHVTVTPWSCRSITKQLYIYHRTRSAINIHFIMADNLILYIMKSSLSVSPSSNFSLIETLCCIPFSIFPMYMPGIKTLVLFNFTEKVFFFISSKVFQL